MAAVTLKSLLRPASTGAPVVAALLKAVGRGVYIVDAQGKPLMGTATEVLSSADERIPVVFEGTPLGDVVGPSETAQAMALLLAHFAARESEGRALAAEVLHLYREVHVIEQLSEQLVALLDSAAVAESALAQAQRLISATHGSVLVLGKQGGNLEPAASFGGSAGKPDPFGPDSRFAASILERCIGEVVNDCDADVRALDSECMLHALICVPMRAGQRNVGTIALGTSNPGTSYSAGDLKLLNTIALQAAAAIENALLCVAMVESARERAAYAAELQAASTVQQLLLHSASQVTPGFEVESVYLPASEVGGDFFLVAPAPDGSITAVVGDVSGKGLTAAMRVAMILGALRRETSHEPGDILSGLNNVLIAQGELGFTTACCVRITLSGEYTIANAGHVSPYLSGRELSTPPALPLGLVPDQTYSSVHGKLARSERLVLLSDGVLEARSPDGELYGFDRLPGLTLFPAQQIADIAQRFGQEDDITVLTLRLTPTLHSVL
jgi:Stage II sporulation protein E (SpoIIE)/GAF domain